MKKRKSDGLEDNGTRNKRRKVENQDQETPETPLEAGGHSTAKRCKGKKSDTTAPPPCFKEQHNFKFFSPQIIGRCQQINENYPPILSNRRIKHSNFGKSDHP